MIDVKRARPGDEALWQEAVSAIVPEGDRDGRLATLDELRTALADERCLLVHARDGEVPVGLASAYVFPDVAAGGKIAYLYDIEVIAERRRAGVGRALTEALVDACEAAGVRLLWAGTEAENLAARRTFEATEAELEGDAYVEYEWELD